MSCIIPTIEATTGINFPVGEITVNGMLWIYNGYLLSFPTSNDFGTIRDIMAMKHKPGHEQGPKQSHNTTDRSSIESQFTFWICKAGRWVQVDCKIDAGGRPVQKHLILNSRYRLDQERG